MEKINRIILYTGIVIILGLSVYSYTLYRQVENNRTKIDEISSRMGKDKALLMDNKIKTEQNDRIIEKLHRDYIARKKFDLHPNYIKYKKEITALIDKQIYYIVNEKPHNQGTWILTKIEFLNPEFVYVEYEDGHGLSATFIQVTKAEKGYRFKALY